MPAINKCLFPAAGYGTRFLPATKNTPKEMLPIVNKPLIQYGVEEAMAAGITGMAIVTGKGKQTLEDHFDSNYELDHQIAGADTERHLTDIRSIIADCTFSYTRQVEKNGLGHAILVGETLIGKEPFAVLLADDYCVTTGDSVLAQMVKLYEQYQCSIVAIEEVPMEEISRYGVIEGALEAEGVYRLNTMVEKPAREDAPSNLAIIGRYILTPDIFDVLRATPYGTNGELQITDALMKQAEQGRVIGYRFDGRRFDCGTIDGFVEATNYTYQKNK